nr:hypothetical protein [Tanacetum cinerariifolium]
MGDGDGDGDEDDNDNEMGFIKFLDFARSTRIPLCVVFDPYLGYASRTAFKQMQPVFATVVVFATVAVIDPLLSTLVGTRGLPSPVSWLGSHTKCVIAATSVVVVLENDGDNDDGQQEG